MATNLRFTLPILAAFLFMGLATTIFAAKPERAVSPEITAVIVADYDSAGLLIIEIDGRWLSDGDISPTVTLGGQELDLDVGFTSVEIIAYSDGFNQPPGDYKLVVNSNLRGTSPTEMMLSVHDIGVANQTCLANEKMIGIDSSGKIICESEECPAGYFDDFGDGSSCINQRVVNCDPVAPPNATSILMPEIIYYDATGWPSPSICGWVCNSDYFDDGSNCINETAVDCLDVAPDGATSIIVSVTIYYTDAAGWTSPSECAYQ